MEEGQAWIRHFGITPADPGFIYILENEQRYKVGKSVNARERIRAAKTWMPDLNVIGIKPFWNVTRLERLLHVGLARCWYHGEWFELIDDGYRNTLIGGFVEFSDADRDRNSVDFIYWFNSSGMAEFTSEQCSQRLTTSRFLRQESSVQKE